jgi:hypothetical protein
MGCLTNPRTWDAWDPSALDLHANESHVEAISLKRRFGPQPTGASSGQRDVTSKRRPVNGSLCLPAWVTA